MGTQTNITDSQMTINVCLGEFKSILHFEFALSGVRTHDVVHAGTYRLAAQTNALIHHATSAALKRSASLA